MIEDQFIVLYFAPPFSSEMWLEIYSGDHEKRSLLMKNRDEGTWECKFPRNLPPGRYGLHCRCLETDGSRLIVGTSDFPWNGITITGEHSTDVQKLYESYRNGEDCAFALRDALLEEGSHELANELES